jgi:hypothetical protein
MAINYIETKSETGRSGIRIEFDSNTDIVKLSGFYDTYVKLHLKKNEWKLSDFLDFLGINDILEKRIKRDSLGNTISNKEEIVVNKKQKPTNNVISSKSKKINKISNKNETLSNLTKETLEFENLPKVQLSYILKKSSQNSRTGSIQVNASIGSERTRFVVPNTNGYSMTLWLSDKKMFDIKHRDYSNLYNMINGSINKCKTALEIKSKELSNKKKPKIEAKDILTYIRDYSTKNQ